MGIHQQHKAVPYLTALFLVGNLRRGKFNIKRGIDGRVQLCRKNSNWMSVRLDMEVPGAILLRDMKTEAIFALETDGLPQVGQKLLQPQWHTVTS